MPKAVNDPSLSGALRDLLGLKGRNPLGIDEILVGVVRAANLEDSPFGSTYTPCGGQRALTPAVGNIAYAGVRPAAGTILRVDKILVRNDTGAARDYTVRVPTATAIAGYDVAPTEVRQLNFNARRSDVNAARQVASLMYTAEDAGAVGAGLGLFRVNDGNIDRFTFPNGFFLHGDDPGGRAAITINPDLADVEIEATFFCRQYRVAA